MSEESLYDLKEYLPLSDCKDGWLYRIRSRNLIKGVFREDRKGFVGIREKFGRQYLFVEDHWDTGVPHGTVKPLECLEQCPIENLNEDIKTSEGYFETNTELFKWLEQKGGVPPESVTRRKHWEDLQRLKKLHKQKHNTEKAE